MNGWEALELARKYEGLKIQPIGFSDDCYFWFEDGYLADNMSGEFQHFIFQDVFEIVDCQHKQSWLEGLGTPFCGPCGKCFDITEL